MGVVETGAYGERVIRETSLMTMGSSLSRTPGRTNFEKGFLVAIPRTSFFSGAALFGSATGHKLRPAIETLLPEIQFNAVLEASLAADLQPRVVLSNERAGAQVDRGATVYFTVRELFYGHSAKYIDRGRLRS